LKKRFILLLIFLSIINGFYYKVKAEGNSELQNAIQQEQVVPVNSITLEVSSQTIEIGKAIPMNAIVSPDNATNKKMIWVTSDDKVATVDAKGLITALKEGTALITAKTIDGTKEATCAITVAGRKEWISKNGKWYYYDYETNTKIKGWLLYNGVWYYLNSNGEMKTGWQYIEGSWYYLNSNGIMITGWLSWNGNWYYLDSNGTMKTGWLLENGTWYYLYSNGEMALNPAGLSSSTSYCIIIDSKNQAVNIFSGYKNHWSFIRTMICSTGAPKTPTIKGIFKVQSKGYMFRAASNTICKYYTGFSGNYLFHTVLLDNDGNIQDPTLGVPVSHGCVRLAIEDAIYIYNNIPYGTTVWSN